MIKENSGTSVNEYGTVTFNSCPHCGMLHIQGEICPRIKSIEYYPDGKIKKVEYREFTLGYGWEWTVDWRK